MIARLEDTIGSDDDAIDLSNMHLSDDVYDGVVMPILNDCRLFSKLNLGWNPIGDASVDALATMLKDGRHEHLEEVSVHRTNISGQGLRPLVNSLVSEVHTSCDVARCTD